MDSESDQASWRIASAIGRPARQEDSSQEAIGSRSQRRHTWPARSAGSDAQGLASQARQDGTASMIDGKLFQRARKTMRLSQCEVADRTGIAQQTISKFESGKRNVSNKIYNRLLLAVTNEKRDSWALMCQEIWNDGFNAGYQRALSEKAS